MNKNTKSCIPSLGLRVMSSELKEYVDKIKDCLEQTTAEQEFQKEKN